MDLYSKNGHAILHPNIHTITTDDVQKIKSLIKRESCPLVLDMEAVEECVNDFYRMFVEFSGISLVNMDSKMLSMLYVTGFDRYVDIYEDDISLEENMRSLVNRKLSLV